jgi:DNA-binding PadR family transcriptional regulator
MAQQFQEMDLTPRMAQVIKVFLEEPSRPRYGFELMGITGLASGSLYPVLARFERFGWLDLGTEDIDPKKAGRPARRFYTITGAAEVAAERQLRELHERFRPPLRVPAKLRVRPQPGLQGGGL